MSLTLHFHPLSSFCWKALVALYENDTPFTPEAFVTCRCATKARKSFRNTEFFSSAGDRIKRIDVYFSATSGWRFRETAGVVSYTRHAPGSPQLPAK